MAVPTEEGIIPAAGRLAILDALTGVGGFFAAPILKLGQNDVIPTGFTVLSDLVEADFTGYSDANGETWSSAYFDTDGSALSVGGEHLFLSTGSAVGNTIYVYYLTDDPATVLLAAYRLANPVGIANAGDGLAVLPFLRFPPAPQ